MSEQFKKIYDHSINNPEKFWQEASNDIFWFKKPTKILNKSNPPFFKWFEDGVTNTCYNALDIHIDQGRGKKTALIYDSPITGNKSQFSYEELRSKVVHEPYHCNLRHGIYDLYWGHDPWICKTRHAFLHVLRTPGNSGGHVAIAGAH